MPAPLVWEDNPQAPARAGYASQSGAVMRSPEGKSPVLSSELQALQPGWIKTSAPRLADNLRTPARAEILVSPRRVVADAVSFKGEITHRLRPGSTLMTQAKGRVNTKL